jgi:hypothetical protein
MKRFALTLLCLVLLTSIAGSVWAHTLTLTGPGALGVLLAAQAPITRTLAGAAVSGEVTVSPVSALPTGSLATFYLDDQARFTSSDPRPELRLDTDQLSEGVHQLRLEVSDGAQLALSTGTLPLHVIRTATQAVTGAARGGGEIPFNKVYRKIILREIIWFNRQEADLEKHAFWRRGSVYITLTDLIRHVGGNITWGPSNKYILVERKGMKIRVTPGSSHVYVNGLKLNLGRPCKQIDSRTYVPVRQMLCLLGINTQFNYCQRRVDVLFRRK